MAGQRKGLGGFITQLALSVYFAITGLCMLGLGKTVSGEEIAAVAEFFKQMSHVFYIIVAVVLVAGGIILFVRAFWHRFSIIDTLVQLVILVLWIAVTVVTLVNSSGELRSAQIMHWLLLLAKNALIIGGLFTVWR